MSLIGIEFQTLKLGANYSPQLSEFIVTEVMDFCDQSANYTLRILGKRCFAIALIIHGAVAHCLSVIAIGEFDEIYCFILLAEGKEEIQVPLGKFSISEDETTSSAETFLLNYMQMKELRLIL